MKLLLYCTKAKPYLVQGLAKPMHTLDTTNPFNFNWKLVNKGFSNDRLNGKIIAECDYEVEEIEAQFYVVDCGIIKEFETKTMLDTELYKRSCLLGSQIDEYLKGKGGYAIHIKNLHIFDEPKELQECATLKRIPDDFHIGYYEKFESVERAPQNMMYVYDENSDNPSEKKVLISIRPEWLCKILNKEKTIEVRRKVLKEMLK